MPHDPAAASTRPLLSVIRGAPGAAELAAVVVVLAARATQPGAGHPGSPGPRRGWSASAARMRPQLTPGPGAWRASALP